MRALLILSLIIGTISCSKSSSDNEEKTTSPVNGATNVGSDDQELAIDEDGNLDYPQLYCKYVEKLRLRTDVSEELGYMCEDGQPTQMMVDYRQTAVDAEPGVITLDSLVSENIELEDKSEFVIAWSFRIPIRPFEVKERPIYDFIAQSYEGDSVTLESTATRQADTDLDFGLHLWSTSMNYKITIQATETRFLNTERNTEYNLYQVQSGNEEMGFGVESLVDTDNPNFEKSTMINLSFNDGGGFNNGEGGTVVITLLHFTLNNQGFPQTATTAINEIANHIAQAMYEGLKE